MPLEDRTQSGKCLALGPFAKVSYAYFIVSSINSATVSRHQLLPNGLTKTNFRESGHGGLRICSKWCLLARAEDFAISARDTTNRLPLDLPKLALIKVRTGSNKKKLDFLRLNVTFSGEKNNLHKRRE